MDKEISASQEYAILTGEDMAQSLMDDYYDEAYFYQNDPVDFSLGRPEQIKAD